VARDLFVFQSMLRGSRKIAPTADDYPFKEERIFNKSTFPRLHFVEKSYSGDCTNWWIPNRACAEALLRTAGFAIQAHPEEEVWVCQCDRASNGERPPRHNGAREPL
jgi:tRNA (mo5U34)-methyltransferase